MYDDCKVAVLSATGGAVSNGMSGKIRVHKVALSHADGSAAIAASMYDAATPTGTIKVQLSTSVMTSTATFERYVESNFNPPLYFETGVSIDISGTGTARVFFTHA